MLATLELDAKTSPWVNPKDVLCGLSELPHYEGVLLPVLYLMLTLFPGENQYLLDNWRH